MDRSQLELNKFLEMDIIEFLDEKLNEKDGTYRKTIAQKVEVALQKGDGESVINTFEELTTKYNSLDSDNTYKAIIYKDILDLVELTKRYSKKISNNEELNNIINDIAESEEIREGNLPDTITAFRKIKMDRAKRELAHEEEEYKNKEEIENKRKLLSKQIFVNIRKKDLSEAILNYRDIKQLFKSYPDKFSEEKEEFYNDILSFYLQIKRLKDELQTKIKELPEKQIDKNATKIDVNKIREIMQEIKQDMEKKDFHSAKSKVIDLKHIAVKIQNKNIRNILETKINSINQNIDFVKRKVEQSE